MGNCSHRSNGVFCAFGLGGNPALRTLAFFSTTTVLGTPVDITLSELALESFFPADPDTTEISRRLAAEDA